MNIEPDESKSQAAPQDASVASARSATTDAESASSGEKQQVAKKRTWKKPKDKPKRPLSAYNIFFQHQRSRIVAGETGEAAPEDIVKSIEAILSKSREKRRHRKTHGRISFGDLARAIAEQWKSISPKTKEIFDHYAEVDMLRYRRELKVWKEKKELESEATAMAKHTSFINAMNSSLSSLDSTSSVLDLDSLPDESGRSRPGDSACLPGGAGAHDAFHSSFSSLDSQSSELSLQPESIQAMMHRQQQILQQQLRGPYSQFGGPAASSFLPQSTQQLPGANAFHSSFGNLNSQFPAFNGNFQFGHSSMTDIGSELNSMPMFNAPPVQQQQRDTQDGRASGHHRGQQTEEYCGNTSASSLQLGDAFFAPSALPLVSDYSTSHNASGNASSLSASLSGVASTPVSSCVHGRASAFSASDGLVPPSAAGVFEGQKEGDEGDRVPGGMKEDPQDDFDNPFGVMDVDRNDIFPGL